MLTPGGAQRIGDLPVGTIGERRGARYDDVSTGTTPPTRFPVSGVTTEPRVQDMAEYIALRVRHDLEVFRHEIRQHVAHVVRDNHRQEVYTFRRDLRQSWAVDQPRNQQLHVEHQERRKDDL